MPYLYAPDRKAEHPVHYPVGFEGTLQVDDYEYGKTLDTRKAESLAFCRAHLRSQLYEFTETGPASIATEALARIAELYRIKAGIRGLSPTSGGPCVKTAASRSWRR